MQTVGRSPCHLRFSQTSVKVMKNSGTLLNTSCEIGIIEFLLKWKNIFVPHNHVVMIKKSRWFVDYFKNRTFCINTNPCVLFSHWVFVICKDFPLFNSVVMNKGFIICERTLSICCARVQQCLSEPGEAFYSIAKRGSGFSIIGSV